MKKISTKRKVGRPRKDSKLRYSLLISKDQKIEELINLQTIALKKLRVIIESDKTTPPVLLSAIKFIIENNDKSRQDLIEDILEDSSNTEDDDSSVGDIPQLFSVNEMTIQ